MSGEKGRLALCLLLSIAVQTAFIAATIRLADIAGVVAPVAAWFFAWPLSKLIATLPISVAGLGVREASLAGFLAPVRRAGRGGRRHRPALADGADRRRAARAR